MNSQECSKGNISVGQRVSAVIEHLKSERLIKNQQEFVDRIGSHKSIVSEVKNEKIKPTNDFLHKIVETFPSLNRDWLLTGEGEMLKGDDQPLDREESGQIESHILRLSGVLDDIQRRILAIDETIKTKDEQINRLLGIIEKMYEK